jgi:hypothetical protein
MLTGMVSVVDVGVYNIVFFIALATTCVLYYSSRRFLGGEFRDFINWVLAAAAAFTCGSFLSAFYVILSMLGSEYAPAFLITAGIAFVLTSLCFVRAALLLLGISKVFGFAELEKDFEKTIKLDHAEKKQKAAAGSSAGRKKKIRTVR